MAGFKRTAPWLTMAAAPPRANGRALDDLLFLCHRIPYPPDKGDKIRSFAMLRHLSRSWRVHLGCFVDDPTDWQHVDALRRYCARLCCLPLVKSRATLRSALGLWRGTSLGEAYFRDPVLAAWTGDVLRKVRPRAAFLYSSVMAQYLADAGPLRPDRVVMDFVDVDSDKWRQYAASARGPARWLYRRESRRLLEAERRIALWAEASVLVSPAEAELFRRLAPAAAGRIHAVSNGIDHAFFAPAPGLPDPFAPGERALVFTGAMDYRPNIDAVTWFAHDVFPSIRAAHAAARFVVVGSNPAPEVRRLAGLPGLRVTGRVPDVRPYLAHAAVAVAPLRLARGLQNKVLEAMAMGCAVVTTPQGLEGIDAQPGRDLLVAATAPRLAEMAGGLLADPKAARAMGEAARRRILEGYGWADKLAAVAGLLSG